MLGLAQNKLEDGTGRRPHFRYVRYYPDIEQRIHTYISSLFCSLRSLCRALQFAQDQGGRINLLRSLYEVLILGCSVSVRQFCDLLTKGTYSPRSMITRVSTTTGL